MPSYTIARYTDGEPLADIQMAESTFHAYMDIAQQPEGLIELAELDNIMHAEWPAELDAFPCNTVVYIQEGVRMSSLWDPDRRMGR